MCLIHDLPESMAVSANPIGSDGCKGVRPY